MKPAGKKLLAILTIALATQIINIDKAVKANEKVNLQNAKTN